MAIIQQSKLNKSDSSSHDEANNLNVGEIIEAIPRKDLVMVIVDTCESTKFTNKLNRKFGEKPIFIIETTFCKIYYYLRTNDMTGNLYH